MHDFVGSNRAAGVGDVVRGSNPFARVMASILGLPRAGRDLPISVEFVAGPGSETIRRDYGQAILVTIQSRGVGRDAGKLVERFGPVTLLFSLHGSAEGISFEQTGARIFGLPLPAALAPRVVANESVEDGWYRYHVDVMLPVLGRIIHYRGRLQCMSDPEI